MNYTEMGHTADDLGNVYRVLVAVEYLNSDEPGTLAFRPHWRVEGTDAARAAELEAKLNGAE